MSRHLNFVLLALSSIVIAHGIASEFGYGSIDPNGRVVGGIASDLHSVPFVVSLSLKGRLKNKQLCAGSIVGKQWIVTAAHCLKDPPYRLIITAGTQTTNFTDSPTAQTRRCDFYRRHEQYSTIFGATGGYDVGVAHISVPFEFTKFVQPIEMREDLNFTRSVSIFGWGSTSKTADRDYPDTLQVANLTLADVKVCEMEHNTTIGVGTLCAGGSVDNKGACIGDSGGPLVQNSALVGLVSWGPPTCNPEHAPTIFTSVGYYIDWIRKQLQTDVDNDNLLK